MARSVQGEAADGDAADRRYLERCLRLAARARGATSPNPMVGAVVVREERVVGEAWHRRAGTPHAEDLALAEAGDAARGATLYTNIEPCCHHGRTPPCVDAIVASGIRRVVACIADPDGRVDRRGFEALRQAGIAVDVGLLATAAARLNEAYLTLKRAGRPFVVAKAALSLDGRLATREGRSQWISGAAARRRAHRLRAVSDAVLVGVGTVLADDPRLTARHVRGPGPRFRVVLDSRLRTPVACRLLAVGGAGEVVKAGVGRQAGRGERGGAGGADPKVLIFASRGASPAARRALQAAGAEVIEVDADSAGRPPWPAVLTELAARDVMSVVLEGGSGVLTSAFEADIIDKLLLFYAPLLIGGVDAPSLWDGAGIGDLESAPRLQQVRRSRLGDDWAVEGYLHPPEALV